MSLQVIKWSLCYKYLYDIGTFHIRHGILRYTDAYELVLHHKCYQESSFYFVKVPMKRILN